MRYAWDLQHQYLRESGLERGVKGAMTRWMLHKLRVWDRASAAGVDVLVANSSYIAERIRKVWRRESVVVHPPVAVSRFTLRREKQDYYLVASRMVPYKRIELVTAAFRQMRDRALVVIGDGPNMKAVRAAAGDAPNITFLGRVSQGELVARMQGARAALHAAEEDFGIAIVEAQACGTPMIAYGRGGALDIVRAPPANDPTGVFFAEQSPESIIAAVEGFEALGGAITPEACRANAMRFGEAVFRDAMKGLVARQLGVR
jgi:glycosyltransferase involved in cell wall biosynthesis